VEERKENGEADQVREKKSKRKMRCSEPVVSRDSRRQRLIDPKGTTKKIFVVVHSRDTPPSSKEQQHGESRRTAYDYHNNTTAVSHTAINTHTYDHCTGQHGVQRGLFRFGARRAVDSVVRSSCCLQTIIWRVFFLVVCATAVTACACALFLHETLCSCSVFGHSCCVRSDGTL